MATERALTTVDHNLPANTVEGIGLGIEGLEQLSQSDLILPRWSIIQPTSKKEGADDHAGQFVRNIDGIFQAAIDAVILNVSPSRLLWSGDLNDKRPECYSRDGANGSKYGACFVCDFNITANPDLKAAKDAGDKSLKVCGYGYNLLLVDDLQAETMALFGAMGTSVRPLKVLITQFQQRRRPPFSAIVRLETERQVNDKGKFYVVKPSIKSWLSAEDTRYWRELYLAIQGKAIKDIDEDQDDSDQVVDSPASQGGDGNTLF